MAGTLCRAYVHTVALTAAYVPVFQVLSAAGLAVVMKSLRLSFDDLATLAPSHVKLTRGETTQGTGTLVTPIAIDEDHDHTLQTKCYKTFSPDPSGSPVIIDEYYLGPGGMVELLERAYRIAPADTLTVWIKGAAASGNVSVTAEFEE